MGAAREGCTQPSLGGATPRRLPLQRHDVVAIGFNFVSSSAAAVLAVLQFGERTSAWHWVLGGVSVLGATAGLTAAAMHGNRVRSAAERRKRSQLVRSLIEDSFRGTIAQMSRAPASTAGVVFLPNRAGELETAFTYNKQGKPDGDLRFKPYVGCTGHAWATKKQAFADLARATPKELETTWKLSPDYVARTTHLKAIVSTPMWAWDDPERLIGIVSVDCDVADEECQLGSPRSLNEALQLAKLIARILTLADVV
jgi:hypothetical protein